MKFRKKGGKGPKGKGKNQPFKKPRKTYSLYANSKSKHSTQSGSKRKFKDYHDKEKEFVKKPKLEEPPQEEEVSSESEDELEDHMKQLRQSFAPSYKVDVLSSEDESEIEDNEGGDSNIDDQCNVESDEEEELDSNQSSAEDEDSSSLSNENANKIELEAEENEDEIELDLETQKEDEDTSCSTDPFAKHILYEMNESLLKSVSSTPMSVETKEENWPELGKIVIQIPKCEIVEEKKPLFSISEQKIYAPAGTVPTKISLNNNSVETLHIKTQIAPNLKKANNCLPDVHNVKLPFTTFQGELFSIINNYQDLYFPGRTYDNAEAIRYVYCLHAVNHILKTRTKVLHHNARLSKKDDVPEEFRDQGLVRPKILIIVPFRDSAYKILTTIINILFKEDKGNVINKNRFIDDFTGNELALPKKNPKPEDYELLFSGNTNDDFKIGITVTKKSLKLYADFYSSDIIVASPLGLRFTIGAAGEAERDYDFLASIELLIFDQTEVFLMQNWDHLLHIINHMHLQPKNSHGTDFSRVRQWSLNGWAKYYRQTLIFSGINLPENNSLFNKKCFNYAGKVKVTNPIINGSIKQVFVQLPHVFMKFEANSPVQAIDARFDFFVRKVLPQHREALMKQTLIFVTNYFDYVKLRNYFKREDISFVQICEYSKDNKIARARDMFFHGDAHFLLYTERYHFFHRIKVKGIRQLIFYQPPVFPHFYYEISNLMQEANMNKKVGNSSNMSVTVLYSKYDVQQLAAVVGTDRAVKMLQSDKNVHMLVTE